MKTELRLQQEIFMYHYNNYPEQRGLLFKIKNEGTNKITGARDKATGLVPGVADMCYLVPNSKPVFFELKTETGIQSKKQKEWQSKIEVAGYTYILIRTLNEFITECQKLN